MPKSQLHKRFSTEQITLFLDAYLSGHMTREEVCTSLDCGKTRFFSLLQQYKNDPDSFTITAKRPGNRRISSSIEQTIRSELEAEQALILNHDMPVQYYNYRAVRDNIAEKTGVRLSAQTIRNRGQQWGFTNPKQRKKKQYRQVETSMFGQLWQHDASDHLWSPHAAEKWKLITTIDDYTRLLLYATFIPEETSWAHIQSAQATILTYGVGRSYYVDSHSIFRFVRSRDSIWQNQKVGTDDIDTDWKQCIEAAGMKVIYATTPEAKGKIERPYRWLQDRVVRECAKRNITTIQGGQMILDEIVQMYNQNWVHSTTQEVPIIRYERAMKEGKNLCVPLELSPPYESLKDIFCLRDTRVVDGYHRISWHAHSIDVPREIPIKSTIELRIIPHEAEPEMRLVYRKRVVKVVKLPLS